MTIARAPRLKGTMPGATFQALRVQMGLTVRDLARLLACTEQAIRNIESPATPQGPGRQVERMMQWLSDPVIRERVEQIQKLERMASFLSDIDIHTKREKE